MRALTCLIALFTASTWALAQPIAKPEGPPVEVIILGTFHFDNPGLDVANMQIDDVLAPKRQTEIGQVLDGLARFNPTKIAVESQRRQPGTTLSERYPLYRAGKMDPSRSETVQIGFALAKRLGHENIHAVDVSGDFPFEAVMAYAKRSGREAQLGASIAMIQSWTAKLSNQLKTQSIGRVLRDFNEPEAIAQDNAFYLDLLRYGAIDEQPGADLVSSWYKRNFQICARIAQAAAPGDRILVVYGSGHAYLLRHCLGGIPGFKILEANDYLPQ